MALSDKNIVITPNIGQTTDPKIVFSGADVSTSAQNITLQMYPTSGGTLSFEGSTGQLFSVTNTMTGTIYSVNDVSGIPSIEVLDTGLVKFAQYSGNVLLGSGTDNSVDKLQVTGTAIINGGIAMTSGWNRSLTLQSTFPGLIFNSNSTKWASINYDHSSNFVIRVGATSNDTFASGVSALTVNATTGAATFGSTVSASNITAEGNITGNAVNITGTYGGTITSSQITTGLGFTPYNSTNPSGYTSNTGTVTSVAGTGTVSGLSLSGTVTTTGNITLSGTLSVAASNFASQTANTFLVAPNGTGGTPTFRVIASADIVSSALGTGTANSTTYLRGDRTWATISGGAAVSNDTTTAANYYPMWTTLTTGTPTTVYVSSTKLYFNPSTGTLNSTVFNSLSDATQKKNVTTVSTATNTVQQLNGVEFNWIDNDKKSSGVIAQELEKVLPHLVDTDESGLKSVNYSGIIAYLIESIKELNAELKDIKEQINIR